MILVENALVMVECILVRIWLSTKVVSVERSYKKEEYVAKRVIVFLKKQIERNEPQLYFV